MPDVAESVARLQSRFAADGIIELDTVGVPDTILRSIAAAEFEAPSRPGPNPVDGELIVDGVSYFSDRIMNAWRISDAVRELALSPWVLETLAELYGRRPLPFQTLNFVHGTQQHAHADTMHFNSDPPGFVAAVWVALEDVDEDNGPVMYYPGSHLLPDAPQSAPENYHDYDERITAILVGSGLTPRYGVLPRGHGLIWTGEMVHAGSPVRDPSRTRRSQVTHYYFEGCRPWVPKRSAEAGRFWSRPEWIC